MLLKKIAILSLVSILFPIMVHAYTPKKEALLVGVSYYQSKNIIRLPGIELDIKKMKRLLESKGFHVTVLLNREATYQNVVNALKDYRYLNSNDSFVFYDSSHGTQVTDNNGDEDDGLDEAYVLYDANLQNEKGLLIDDTLNRLLSYIPAKKLTISDACHSGTIYKGLYRDIVTKFTPISKDFHFINKDTARIIKPKNLVSLGAVGDTQESIATPDGSLFTDALSDSWSSNPKISFNNIKKDISIYINNEHRHNPKIRITTPTLYATNSRYINQSINSYLNIDIYPNHNQKLLVESYLDELMHRDSIAKLYIQSKPYYNKGEYIDFTIKTYNMSGHLYLLTSKERDNSIDIIYPNSYYQNPKKRWRGEFQFPRRDEQFAFQAKNITNVKQRNVVYAILSQEPIPILEEARELNLGRFKFFTKNFIGEINLKNAIKDIIIRKNNQVAIGKVVFTIGR